MFLRYDIIAPRDPHVAQYDAMIRHLQSLNFEFLPPLEQHPETDREDPGKDRLVGLLAPDKMLELFRNKSVATVLLMPEDYKVPEQLDQPVGVRLELAPGFAPGRTRELADQARVLLKELGFREAVGYDHHGYTGRPYTRLVGTVPAGQLFTLLKDLRRQPAGWLAPRIAQPDLPAPLRNVNPLIIAEVIPGYQPLSEPARPAPRGKDYLDKISADLWALVSKKEPAVTPVQVVLSSTPREFDTDWRRRLLETAPSLFIEGRLGPVVTGTIPVAQIDNLAALPEVSVVRLPRPAWVQIDPAVKIKGDNERALKQSGLAELHKRKFRGQDVRLAIIDTDFRGHDEMIKKKQLPATTRLVDLTAERSPDIVPLPYAGAAGQIGHGTQCALAAAVAAPAADLTLIRIAGTAPFQLQQVSRHLGGDILSEYLVLRRDELELARGELLRERDVILRERKLVLEDFEDDIDNEREYGYLGPVRGWIFSARAWHRERLAYQERQEQEFAEREGRFLRLVRDIRDLKGIRLVANALLWNDGYPLGGASALSRWLDDLPFRSALWFQSAGNTRGQSWSGSFRDMHDTGVLEFAPVTAPVPKGHWTRTLNFLGWQPYEAASSPDLPAQAKLHVSIQWREPHDRDYYPRLGDPDFYRKPLADLRLILLRQRDPGGTKLPADDFEVAARSTSLPQRLDHQPTFAVYEQELEFTVDKPGRYALRVERQVDSRWVLETDPVTGNPAIVKLEGLVPSGIRPLGAATLPALERNWELRPRIFVAAMDDASRKQGRPVFVDFPTDLGSAGIPADSRQVFTIAAATLNDVPEPYSAAGPPANLELFRKNILAYDTLQLGPEGTGGAYGTSVAASFAAGLAAAVMSSGMSQEQMAQYLRRQSGKVLRVPNGAEPSVH